MNRAPRILSASQASMITSAASGNGRAKGGASDSGAAPVSSRQVSQLGSRPSSGSTGSPSSSAPAAPPGIPEWELPGTLAALDCLSVDSDVEGHNNAAGAAAPSGGLSRPGSGGGAAVTATLLAGLGGALAGSPAEGLKHHADIADTTTPRTQEALLPARLLQSPSAASAAASKASASGSVPVAASGFGFLSPGDLAVAGHDAFMSKTAEFSSGEEARLNDQLMEDAARAVQFWPPKARNVANMLDSPHRPSAPPMARADSLPMQREQFGPIAGCPAGASPTRSPGGRSGRFGLPVPAPGPRGIAPLPRPPPAILNMATALRLHQQSRDASHGPPSGGHVLRDLSLHSHQDAAAAAAAVAAASTAPPGGHLGPFAAYDASSSWGREVVGHVGYAQPGPEPVHGPGSGFVDTGYSGPLFYEHPHRVSVQGAGGYLDMGAMWGSGGADSYAPYSDSIPLPYAMAAAAAAGAPQSLLPPPAPFMSGRADARASIGTGAGIQHGVGPCDGGARSLSGPVAVGHGLVMDGHGVGVEDSNTKWEDLTPAVREKAFGMMERCSQYIKQAHFDVGVRHWLAQLTRVFGEEAALKGLHTVESATNMQAIRNMRAFITTRLIDHYEQHVFEQDPVQYAAKKLSPEHFELLCRIVSSGTGLLWRHFDPKMLNTIRDLGVEYVRARLSGLTPKDLNTVQNVKAYIFTLLDKGGKTARQAALDKSEAAAASAAPVRAYHSPITAPGCAPHPRPPFHPGIPSPRGHLLSAPEAVVSSLDPFAVTWPPGSSAMSCNALSNWAAAAAAQQRGHSGPSPLFAADPVAAVAATGDGLLSAGMPFAAFPGVISGLAHSYSAPPPPSAPMLQHHLAALTHMLGSRQG